MGSNTSNVKTINVETARTEKSETNNTGKGILKRPDRIIKNGAAKLNGNSETSTTEQEDIMENDQDYDGSGKGENMKDTYFFDSDGNKRYEEPVAYRDADGKIKFYNDENVPIVWVPNDSGSAPKDAKSEKKLSMDNKSLPDDEERAGRPKSTQTSRSEGHAPRSVPKPGGTKTDDGKPKAREGGFLSPYINSRVPEQSVTSRTKASITVKSLPTEYTLFRDGTFIQGAVKSKEPVIPEFKPPSITRRDLIPEEDMFEDIDEHVLKTPKIVKEDLAALVSYLTEPACTPLDEVRAFYMWITQNINYDTSGLFGRSEMMKTDPESVLKTRVTVCKGYARLLDAFCKKVAVPSKIIRGYVKGYGYQPGDDVTKDSLNAHMWNAVYVENNWFLVDATFGAGYVKAKEKTYVPKFNPLYFICDPSIFICDHFPFVKGDSSNNDTNQLLAKPITFEEFNSMLNMEKCGKEWGIEPISHRSAVIKDIKFELDIQLQQTFMPMSDYLAFLYRDGQKIDQFTYTIKTDLRTVNVHVLLPRQGEHALQIYGRRKQDPPDSNLQPLVRYVLKCQMAYDNPTPYPNHHTLYGLVDDPEKYGISDVGEVINVAVNGEAILTLKPAENAKRDYTDLLPRLFYGDHATELKTQTFIEYAENFVDLNIRARLPFIGYFKLVLFGKPMGGTQIKPFVTFLIENKRVVNEEGFPTVHVHALKYKCRLQEPLRRGLSAGKNNLVLVSIKSKCLAKVRAHGTMLTKSDDVTFEGHVTAPSQMDADFVIYGAEKEDESDHPLYTCRMIAGNILAVPSAISSL